MKFEVFLRTETNLYQWKTEVTKFYVLCSR